MGAELLNQFAACAAGAICLDKLPQTPADGNTFNTIMTIVISIIAVVSLLFIVIGGMRYVLSQGDPKAVGQAKSTILYAIVGLVVAILAQVIVAYVIGRAV